MVNAEKHRKLKELPSNWNITKRKANMKKEKKILASNMNFDVHFRKDLEIFRI